jgi:hypothetical protein
VLAHWNNSSQVDMLLHSNTLSWFRAHQSLLLVLLLSRGAANTNFIALGVNKPGLESKIYNTWGEHATSNYYATDVAIKQNHN